MRTAPGPPPTPAEPVIDEMHGRQVVDPYRWLEDGDSEATRRWTDAQNAYSREILDAIPGRDELGARIGELLSVGIVTAPTIRDERAFFQRREGEQNQPVLLVREGIDGPERVLLDPNSASAEGTTALDWWFPSHDGRLLAYGYSENGSEWSVLHVLDVDSRTELPDRIERARHASVAWLANGTGFYYTRYPYPGEVPEGEENYNVGVFFHRLRSDAASDTPVVVRPKQREEISYVVTSRDGRYLLVGIQPDFYRTDLYLKDLSAEDAPFVPVAEGLRAKINPTFAGETLYLHTDLDAPRYRLFATPCSAPRREHWREVIPERQDAVLDAVVPWNERLIGEYLRNATSQIEIFDADGAPRGTVQLPVLGTITGLTGRWDAPHAFYSFESFTMPTAVYRLTEDGASVPWAAVDAPISGDDFDVRQEWYTSRDGTRVSFFLVHRRDLDRSTSHPTYLTGYGGFTLSRTPLFLRDACLFLERGGIYALPNLRGGGEYGEEWHRAGMLERKQNVFDDFICAAEHLIASGYTTPEKLAISGRSNGGLLVGAAMVQRPDLFRAVVCGVPLLDMLRYHHFLIARLWIPEYGSADDPEQFEFLHAYSPYHRVRDGGRYPAVLFITAESDSRVDPLHARKMAARLQAASGSDRPVLIRIESRAGHGMGKPLTKWIEDQTDLWGFVLEELGMI